LSNSVMHHVPAPMIACRIAASGEYALNVSAEKRGQRRAASAG
jgi:hypothetical protein